VTFLFALILRTYSLWLRFSYILKVLCLSIILFNIFFYRGHFSLFSLKLNIFPFSASILTFSTENNKILTYFIHFDTTHFFYEYYNIIQNSCIAN
jgi:hypothetical protein